MSRMAEIIHTYGAAYQRKYGAKMLASHRRALSDLAACRTAAFGGHLYQCPACQQTHYQFHSCQNRHCPQCQWQAGQDWLDKQRALLLPVPYFLLTFTLPQPLRRLARRHQKLMYSLLFRAAAEALQQLAQDPRYVGGQLGLIGVLHTWGRQLTYHPHVHFLVPGGGLAADGQTWLPARSNFLVPVKALSRLFRAKFRLGLRAHEVFTQVPAACWRQDWVVHAKAVGDGERALRYLAPYIFRVAIGNRRIIKADQGKVTFRYRPSDTGTPRLCTVSAEEFLRRFLQHVLPKGFVKVRYYGFFSAAWRQRLPALHTRLAQTQPTAGTAPSSSASQTKAAGPTETTSLNMVMCPHCGQVMAYMGKIQPRGRCPP